MAFSIGVGPVDTTDNDGNSTASIVLNGVTAGRSLAVCIRWVHAFRIVDSVECTDESNLSLLTRWGDGTRNIQWATKLNVTTSGNKTITVTFSGAVTHVGIMVVELVGGNLTTLSGNVGNADGTSTDPTVGITTEDDGAAILAGCFTSNATDPSAGGGYTDITFGETTGSAHGEYDLDAGAAGLKTANFTGPFSSWVISAVSFAPAGPLDFSYSGAGGAEGNSGADFDFDLVLHFSYIGVGGAEGNSAALLAGLVGEAFTLDRSLLVVTLSATLSPYPTGLAEFDLPVVTVAATLLHGLAFSAAFPLHAATLEAALITGHAFLAEFSLPVGPADATLLSDGILSADFNLPVMQLSAQALAGGLFSAAPQLPVLILSGNILQDGIFSAAFNLPPQQLLAALSPTLAAAFRTWALNTRRNALTEYDFTFTSYALFNGLVLGVSSAGVVVLGTQAVDGTLPITGRARTGKADYGETHLKRVPRLYVGGEFDGDVLFRTIIDATGERTYRLSWNRVDGMQQRRVPIGKGPKARYWQYEIEGENGADFTIENVLAYPTGLRRRVM
jgi:hypothetical protein